MTRIPWTVRVQEHLGSSAEDIANESDWDAVHPHRVGFKANERLAGITHGTDQYAWEIEAAQKEEQELEERESKGDLVNFRDLITHHKTESFHLKHPENRSLGWRYVLNVTEDWVKNVEDWPANIERRRAQEKKKKEREVDGQGGSQKQEHEWRKSEGGRNGHNDAYAVKSDRSYDAGVREGDRDKVVQDSQSDQGPKYSAQEVALLRALKHEKDYISKLESNHGRKESPQKRNRTQISIDEQDQFSPDNWLPRASDLIRLTGKHPLNAEPHLTHLFDAGLITPNELHYVRNHGAVPRLLYEFHRLDIENGKLVLSMVELKQNYEAVNIPIALACDGNRRKELNMIRMSKGFNWGPAAISCAYWKGPLLRDVLLSAGIGSDMWENVNTRLWVNFEGADELSEGKYATSIPLEYGMDPANDVILAYEMNDVPLPPDHGYPVRLMVPGVLPSFVTEKDGEFAETLFNHPDTACHEQNLNSVIVKPSQGEKISLKEARKGQSFRIAGYAYDGGGHEVQRVEVSLDDGETWLYCIRKFPEYPIRHGNKFWTWLHWHVDVELPHLLRASSITVRCFNIFKNTQPREPNWNIMGMMNNCWYIVRPEIVVDEESDFPSILFRHPTEPATGDGGWMKPSMENQIENVKQEAGTPQEQFTREEVEKHDNERDCWIVVDGKVYDATSVLDWHPGGKAAVLSHAGRVHQETTDEFASIHDGYAYQKLKEKAANFLKKLAEQSAKEKSSAEDKGGQLSLQKYRWVPVTLIDRREISEDTRAYTFSLPDSKALLGLGTCQHIQLGFHMKDRMLIRSYTPTRPILPAQGDASRSLEDRSSAGHESSHRRGVRDGDGTFDLTIKTYFPDDKQPGGAMSNILDCLPIGEQVELRGPTGEILYKENGHFMIEGRKRHFDRVSLVLGGSGITPGYALIARILMSENDGTMLRVVDANKSEKDILLRKELDEFQIKSRGQLSVTHVLSHPSDSWEGLKGHVNEEIIKKSLFEPNEKSVVFLCGPPAMIQKAALPALKDWGYREDENMFGF
ncbi:hypothetical protein DL764_007901 [Monosporascus ibericus]|uniref:Nitrate reductase [NADPH] n=1 Tax=Monosporascus ibericus TaxID=155417 RepID=A0A4Q4SYV5_9PEZI|nr:hypothetical protein DL764_007901 [Monosporascus ibericus]